MKVFIRTIMAVSCLAIFATSCKREDIKAPSQQISAAVMQQIAAKGFSTADVIKVDEGYLVEGDIILTNESLGSTPQSPNLLIANEEQYRTFNLVTKLPRTVTVSASSGIGTALSNALNSAISRYNALNLTLKFSRVSSGGQINIRLVNTGQYIASSGFPTSSGNPYFEVKYSNKYSNYSAGFMTTVLAHEIGHCIGFRHTDYMNRAYSCGSGGNEGQVTTGIGAVLIPGTPSGPDAKSWMLSCLSSTTDRPFNSNDKVALNYLY